MGLFAENCFTDRVFWTDGLSWCRSYYLFFHKSRLCFLNFPSALVWTLWRFLNTVWPSSTHSTITTFILKTLISSAFCFDLTFTLSHSWEVGSASALTAVLCPARSVKLMLHQMWWQLWGSSVLVWSVPLCQSKCLSGCLFVPELDVSQSAHNLSCLIHYAKFVLFVIIYHVSDHYSCSHYSCNPNLTRVNWQLSVDRNSPALQITKRKIQKFTHFLSHLHNHLIKSLNINYCIGTFNICFHICRNFSWLDE